jgi:CDP-diacylglycerol--inositol 3-phosphatidyltransferase
MPNDNNHHVATRAVDVFLYIPNLIGFARVGLSALGFFLMMLSSFANEVPVDSDTLQQRSSTWRMYGVVCYLLSFVGDLFDGVAARYFHQTSTFGSVLDMVTDRCSTLGLLQILSNEYSIVDQQLQRRYPQWIYFPFFRVMFLFLSILDVASHWCQMYSTCMLNNGSGSHHKSETGNAGRHFLVRWFYKYYWFFGYLCVGTEFMYITLYIRMQYIRSLGFQNNIVDYTAIFTKQSIVIDLFLAVCIPACLAKQSVNVSQLLSACYAIAQYDANQKMSESKQS